MIQKIAAILCVPKKTIGQAVRKFRGSTQAVRQAVRSSQISSSASDAFCFAYHVDTTIESIPGGRCAQVLGPLFLPIWDISRIQRGSDAAMP